MIINLQLTSNAQGAPQPIKDAWNTAAAIIQNALTDNITINLQVDWTGTGGGAFAGPASGHFYNYSAIYTKLTTNASPGDSTFASLPNTSTIGGQSQVAVWYAQEKAMGLRSATDPAIDGTSSFATDISASNMIAVALHEFTHAMGRVPYGPQPDILEFFRYTSPGNRLYDGGVPASSSSYFSLDGGLTKWADYGVSSDPSDMLNNSLTTNDSFNEFYNNSTVHYLTPFALEQMDALGFHLKFNAPAAEAHDFNGDNSGDILVQNGSGQISYAKMANGAFNGWATVANTPGYTVVGEGKISGNTSSDVVIQNSSGQICYAKLVNGAFSQWVVVGSTPGWNVVGVADINRDHHADIVVQNASTGQISYANMSNGTLTGWVNVVGAPGYQVAACADINFDGCADIVIQNAGTGQIVYANMANGAFAGWNIVSSTPGYTVKGAADINRDGYADVVIQNQTTGNIVYANMKNGVFNGWVNIASTPGWTVSSIEDVNGNGFADIVIQSSSGQFVYADMTTGTFQGWVSIVGAPGYTGHTAPGTAVTAANTSHVAFQGGSVGGALQSGNAGDMFDHGAQGSGIVAGASSHIVAAPGTTLSDHGLESNAIAGVNMFDPGFQGANIPGLTVGEPAFQHVGASQVAALETVQNARHF